MFDNCNIPRGNVDPMPEVTWMRWMSKRPHCESLRALVAGWLLLGFVLGGCSTVVSRIDQHAELFASLDKETQNTLLGGEAKLGYTTAMTYIAYGPPNETRHKNDTRRGISCLGLSIQLPALSPPPSFVRSLRRLPPRLLLLSSELLRDSRLSAHYICRWANHEYRGN